VVDCATLTLVESLLESRYENLARRVARMPAEERFHLEFAEGRVRELGEFTGGREQFAAHLNEMLMEMLCWFGPPAELGIELLVAQGLLAHDGEQMRQSFLGRVAPLLLEVGVVLPLRWDLATRQWECDGLPWERWNALQRRLQAAATTQ
jgi:ring-1,2-phenylacetyl-CoA epoxidase subunit PaaA/ring-1,2-phenylacetyl-CoA epoxidase subunit PaaC